MTFNASATDQFMLNVLADEFTIDEADNALTALSSLSAALPALFPDDRTFVRPDHQKGHSGPSGVRFVVFGDRGTERVIRLPRAALSGVDTAVNEVFAMASIYGKLAA